MLVYEGATIQQRHLQLNRKIYILVAISSCFDLCDTRRGNKSKKKKKKIQIHVCFVTKLTTAEKLDFK